MQRKQSHARTVSVNDEHRARYQSPFMRSNLTDDEISVSLPVEILKAQQNCAWALSPGDREQTPEIEIARQHHVIICARPCLNIFVIGVRRADLRPVHRFYSVGSERCLP